MDTLNAAPPVFIHVGFANTGTTSLQHNFFAARRQDILYFGELSGEWNHMFPTIKHAEDFEVDFPALIRMRDELIEKSSGRPIIISDETLTETHQLYFAPYLMPRDTIALRLKHLFPAAKILFTIRDQRRYCESMYLNLKRNAAYFDGMPMPPFSEWLKGNMALLRPHYLQNLNFSDCIGLYADVFGRENICVLPLEMASADGARAYLNRVCSFVGLELREEDVTAFASVRNRRMSARQELVAELLEDKRFRRLYADLLKACPEQFLGLLNEAPPSTVAMLPADEAVIRQRVDLSNSLLACEFQLDLERYDYPLPEEQEFSYEGRGQTTSVIPADPNVATRSHGASILCVAPKHVAGSGKLRFRTEIHCYSSTPNAAVLAIFQDGKDSTAAMETKSLTPGEMTLFDREFIVPIECELPLVFEIRVGLAEPIGTLSLNHNPTCMENTCLSTSSYVRIRPEFTAGSLSAWYNERHPAQGTGVRR